MPVLGYSRGLSVAKCQILFNIVLQVACCNWIPLLWYKWCDNKLHTVLSWVGCFFSLFSFAVFDWSLPSPLKNFIFVADNFNKPEKQDYVYRPFLRMPGHRPPYNLESQSSCQEKSFFYEKSEWQKEIVLMHFWWWACYEVSCCTLHQLNFLWRISNMLTVCVHTSNIAFMVARWVNQNWLQGCAQY